MTEIQDDHSSSSSSYRRRQSPPPSDRNVFMPAGSNDVGERTRHYLDKIDSSRDPLRRERAKRQEKSKDVQLRARNEKLPFINRLMRIKYDPENPFLVVIWKILAIFEKAYRGEAKYNFIDNEEEVVAYENLHGPMRRRRDKKEIAFRAIRPPLALMAHLWCFFDFPRSPVHWGLLILLDMFLLGFFYIWDPKAVTTELNHWDYARAFSIFFSLGTMSILHQIYNMAAPVVLYLVVLSFTAHVLHAAITKGHQNY